MVTSFSTIVLVHFARVALCLTSSPKGHRDGLDLGEGIAADYAHGCLTGIDVLDAVKRLGDPIVFKRVKLEDVAIARQAVTASTRQMRRNRTSRLKPKASFNRAREGLGYRSVPAGNAGSFARV